MLDVAKLQMFDWQPLEWLLFIKYIYIVTYKHLLDQQIKPRAFCSLRHMITVVKQVDSVMAALSVSVQAVSSYCTFENLTCSLLHIPAADVCTSGKEEELLSYFDINHERGSFLVLLQSAAAFAVSGSCKRKKSSCVCVSVFAGL